jgi:hypothetical protein
MAEPLFKDEWVEVTTARVATTEATYAVRDIAGTKVGVIRGSVGGRILGLLILFGGLYFGSCSVFVDAATGDDHGKLVGLGIFTLGLLVFGLNSWWGRPIYVVYLNIGGNEVALVNYTSLETAKVAAAAVLTAIETR